MKLPKEISGKTIEQSILITQPFAGVVPLNKVTVSKVATVKNDVCRHLDFESLAEAMNYYSYDGFVYRDTIVKPGDLVNDTSKESTTFYVVMTRTVQTDDIDLDKIASGDEG